MAAELACKQQLLLNAEIEKIISAYSEADREQFTDKLLEVIKSSEAVKVLDETKASNPGTLHEVLRVCLAVGKVDASLAWVIGVSNSAWSVRSCFHALGKPTAMEHNKILAMVLGRPGSLKKDAYSGNYLLSGEWRYASGWKYSSFFFCLAAIENSDPPDIQMVAVPSRQLELSGNWQAVGLRGTQSVAIRAQDIEITNNNMESFSRILSGKNHVMSSPINGGKHPSYSGLFTGVLMCCLLGAILGATEAALEYVITTIDKRPIAGSTYKLMSDSGAIRAEIGRLRSALDLYKRAAEYNANAIDKAAHNQNMSLTTQNRVDNRARAALVMRGCVNIVQDLLWIYGSSGLDKGNTLEKIWRDVNVGARHGGFSKFVPEEAVGLAAIGHDPRNLTQMF